MKLIPAVLFCWSVAFVGTPLVADTGRLDAERTPMPLVELLLSNDLTNTGSLGGEARLVKYADGQGPRFGAGRVGMGLDLTASSRGGGRDRSQAGGAALVDAPAVGRLRCFTVSLWFRPIGKNSPARLLYYAPSWDLFVAGTAIGFKTKHNRRDRLHLTPKDRSPVVEGRWNFVAITFDGRTGQARCYHALDDASPQLICIWSDVPEPDRGTAVLEVGNLEGIRPFRGWIDNVRVFDQALTAEQIQRLVTRDRPPRPSLPERARSLPARLPLFDHSDVCLSSRSKRPNSIETIRAFRANRLMWCYSADAASIQ
ncbi:MAG TPA: LamG domain-containing protein, partial [Planctomycetaceae bacterium]|nr:LamG domain-containing protein [Planctomycetaceae bacterium]